MYVNRQWPEPLSRGALLRSSALGAALLIACPAWAQPAAPAGAGAVPAEPTVTAVEVYTAEDFVRFAPRSALDMLQQIPGFSIDRQEVARGLGQASGNVLINGQRMSSKSASAQDQLSRISAKDVIRIEIVEGATLNIPGLSGRVANVIAHSSDVSGQFLWEPQLPTEFAAFRWSQGKVSISGRRGALDFTLALENAPFYGGNAGPNLVVDGAGNLEPRFTLTKSKNDQPKLSGTVRIDGPGGSVINFNASAGKAIVRSWEREHGTDPELPERLETLRNRRDGHSYELGGDIQFSLGPGRLKLIGLDRADSFDFLSESSMSLTGSPDRGVRFVQTSDSGERIGRAEYDWRLGGADWQLSAEAAFNRLDNVAGLFLLNPAGEFIAAPFLAGTGGVREDRYDTILSYGRPLTPSLSLQLALGGEYSKLAQTGANAESRSFLRPKGSLTLAWALPDELDISFELRRRVGQLNFADFLANVNLERDNANAGNNQLVPEQSWDARIEASKDFGVWGSATLALFHNWIEDYVTVVPLPGGGESTGNVAKANHYGLQLTGTWRLDPVGLRGAKLDLGVDVSRSSFEDPLTHLDRGFNSSPRHEVRLDLRHDVPDTDWAWGASVRETDFAPYYRLAEFGFDHAVRTFASVFIEHKDVFGLTVRARVSNLLEGNAVLARTVYAGPRDSAPILFTENQQREIGRVVNLAISGSF